MTLELDTWYRIPFFNGYEICLSTKQYYLSYEYSYKGKNVFFILRSFKNYKKYPGGYILPYHHKGKNRKINSYYEMTDINNNRVKLKISDIIKWMEKPPYENTTAHNRINMGSRNSIIYAPEGNITLTDRLRKSSLLEDNRKMVDAIYFDADLWFNKNNLF